MRLKKRVKFKGFGVVPYYPGPPYVPGRLRWCYLTWGAVGKQGIDNPE